MTMPRWTKILGKSLLVSRRGEVLKYMAKIKNRGPCYPKLLYLTVWGEFIFFLLNDCYLCCFTFLTYFTYSFKLQEQPSSSGVLVYEFDRNTGELIFETGPIRSSVPRFWKWVDDLKESSVIVILTRYVITTNYHCSSYIQLMSW